MLHRIEHHFTLVTAQALALVMSSTLQAAFDVFQS